MPKANPAVVRPLPLAAQHAAERLFFGGPIEYGRAAGDLRSPRVAPSKRNARGPKGSGVASKGRPASTRDLLGAFGRGAPEAVVKVNGGMRSLRSIGRHFSYLTRGGVLEIEDQDGDRQVGGEHLDSLVADWGDAGAHRIPQTVGLAAGSDGKRHEVGVPETLNLVLSMPPGTALPGLTGAVRAFARSEFQGHRYVMVLHAPSEDPGPKPVEHPHVHLTVRKVSDVGVRLNPRKADLRRWRAVFADELRRRGIDAAATGRAVRGQRDPGSSLAATKMKERGARRDAGPRIDAKEAVERNERTAAAVALDWTTVLKSLGESDMQGDRTLAAALARRLDALGIDLPKRLQRDRQRSR